MTPSTEARAHLRKAEFLAAAQDNLEERRYDAATSSAVTSGINAADAMCIALTGVSARTNDHTDAVARLKAAGGLAAPMATTLNRLLGYKNQSQYQSSPMPGAKAANAVAWAERLCGVAREVVTSR